MKDASAPADRDTVISSALQDLRELAEGSDDPGQFRELVDVFLAELLSGLSSMRKALAENDNKGLARLAHSLKGASASMGASRLAFLCFQLEQKGKEGLQEPPAEIVTQIESEAGLVRETINKALSE